MTTPTLTRAPGPERQLKVRKTVAGGALNTAKLTKQLPDTVSWALDFYLLCDPLDELVTCNDPEVTTVDEWKKKARRVSMKFAELSQRLQAMAT